MDTKFIVVFSYFESVKRVNNIVLFISGQIMKFYRGVTNEWN